jgi:chromosome segregation ATPase
MSNIIGDLQHKLKQSWEETNDDSTREQDVVDISTLAFNLSTQAEYNNELLEYIRELESSLQNSEAYRHQLGEKYEALHENYRETSDRADDLYHKLQISSSLCDELSAQLKAMRSDNVSSYEDSEKNRETIESLSQQNAFLEKSNKQFTERIHRLESEVDEARRFKKSILSDETTETITTLSFSLESTQHELERTRKEYMDMQLVSSDVKDENIQLMHRLEHLSKQRDDDASFRETANAKLREATMRANDLQQQVGN